MRTFISNAWLHSTRKTMTTHRKLIIILLLFINIRPMYFIVNWWILFVHLVVLTKRISLVCSSIYAWAFYIYVCSITFKFILSLAFFCMCSFACMTYWHVWQCKFVSFSFRWFMLRKSVYTVILHRCIRLPFCVWIDWIDQHSNAIQKPMKMSNRLS